MAINKEALEKAVTDALEDLTSSKNCTQDEALERLESVSADIDSRIDCIHEEMKAASKEDDDDDDEADDDDDDDGTEDDDDEAEDSNG